EVVPEGGTNGGEGVPDDPQEQRAERGYSQARLLGCGAAERDRLNEAGEVQLRGVSRIEGVALETRAEPRRDRVFKFVGHVDDAVEWMGQERSGKLIRDGRPNHEDAIDQVVERRVEIGDGLRGRE